MKLLLHDISESKIIFEGSWGGSIPRFGETVAWYDNKKSSFRHYLVRAVHWDIKDDEITVIVKVIEY